MLLQKPWIDWFEGLATASPRLLHLKIRPVAPNSKVSRNIQEYLICDYHCGLGMFSTDVEVKCESDELANNTMALCVTI